MSSQKWAWVAATLDTKLNEALYACDLLEAAGLPVKLADLSTKGRILSTATKSGSQSVGTTVVSGTADGLSLTGLML